MAGSILGEGEYASLLKRMGSVAGISSQFNLRKNMEQQYFLHHKAKGTRLRSKYRMN